MNSCGGEHHCGVAAWSLDLLPPNLVRTAACQRTLVGTAASPSGYKVTFPVLSRQSACVLLTHCWDSSRAKIPFTPCQAWRPRIL
jgi:hypothetical protein